MTRAVSGELWGRLIDGWRQEDSHVRGTEFCRADQSGHV